MLETTNTEWGFFGQMTRTGKDAGVFWAEAMTLIGEATGHSEERVQKFLDSREGRHFADDVHNTGSVQGAVERWNGGKAKSSCSYLYRRVSATSTGAA